MRSHVRRSRRVAVVGTALLLILGSAGCGGGTKEDAEGQRKEKIRAAVADAGKVVVPEAFDHETFPPDEERGDYRYTYEQHDALTNLEGVAYLGLNDDVIWPGSLVAGDRLNQYVYTPIAIPRAPLTLSVSLEGAGGTGVLSRTVAEPSLANVRQGIQDLLGTAITEETKLPARVDYQSRQVTSQSHMNLFVGADVKYGGGSLSTRLDFTSTTYRTKMLAKYTQIFYTVDVDPPAGPEMVLADGVTGAQVRSAMPPGTRPVYVASVAYGMMAIMVIETNFTSSEMSAALDAAYSGSFDVDITSGYTAQDILDESSITVIVYGGSTRDLDQILYGADGFKKLIAAARDYDATTPGVPILYKFRHLQDNTLAQVSLTSQYTIVRPVQLRQRVQVCVSGFGFNQVEDESGGVDITALDVWVNAWQRRSPGDPEVRVGAADQPVYHFPGGETEVGGGAQWLADACTTLEFDTENYDFGLARLEIGGYSCDVDTWSGNDLGSAYYPLSSSSFFSGGAKTMSIASTGNQDGDYRIDTSISVRDGTR